MSARRKRRIIRIQIKLSLIKHTISIHNWENMHRLRFFQRVAIIRINQITSILTCSTNQPGSIRQSLSMNHLTIAECNVGKFDFDLLFCCSIFTLKTKIASFIYLPIVQYSDLSRYALDMTTLQIHM